MADAYKRPRGIAVTALGVILFQLLGLISVGRSWAAAQYLFIWTAGLTVLAIGILLWFYWKGRNWARWIVMIQAVFTNCICLGKAVNV